MIEPKVLVVFLPNWIGDVVMATPAIVALRERYPTAKFLSVCKPYVAETLAGSPWFDDVILWNRRGASDQRTLSVIKRLRAENVDTSVLFTNSLRPALLSRLAGCSQVVGFARYARNLLLTKRLYPHRDARGRLSPYPAILDYNKLAVALGTADPGVRMRLFTTIEHDAQAAKLLTSFDSSRPLVGLNSGGAFGSSKHWLAESFAEVARTLIDTQNANVVVLCGPSEVEQAATIVSETARPGRIISAASGDVPLSIGLSKAIVKRLDLLLTTDSGPRHFAAAFDVPVVTLFGPTHIGWTETYFDKAKHVQLKLPCGPCQQRVCPLGHHRCMKELTPAMVLAPAFDLLRRFKDDPPEVHHVRQSLPLAG